MGTGFKIEESDLMSNFCCVWLITDGWGGEDIGAVRWTLKAALLWLICAHLMAAADDIVAARQASMKEMAAEVKTIAAMLQGANVSPPVLQPCSLRSGFPA